jgi:hypothetical protein
MKKGKILFKSYKILNQSKTLNRLHRIELDPSIKLFKELGLNLIRILYHQSHKQKFNQKIKNNTSTHLLLHKALYLILNYKRYKRFEGKQNKKHLR